jgi:hypothetical protein
LWTQSRGGCLTNEHTCMYSLRIKTVYLRGRGISIPKLYHEHRDTHDTHTSRFCHFQGTHCQLLPPFASICFLFLNCRCDADIHPSFTVNAAAPNIAHAATTTTTNDNACKPSLGSSTRLSSEGRRNISIKHLVVILTLPHRVFCGWCIIVQVAWRCGVQCIMGAVV